jgi:plasmid stabilization system protein ParE
MSKLYYSPAALRDLDDIWDYICEELGNPTAAVSTVNRIQDNIGKLRDFPEMGSPLSSIVLIETDYRFLVCGNYLSFYRIRGEGVYIDRILYGRRDYLRILFGDRPEREK